MKLQEIEECMFFLSIIICTFIDNSHNIQETYLSIAL